jgi:hypothetical protein
MIYSIVFSVELSHHFHCPLCLSRNAGQVLVKKESASCLILRLSAISGGEKERAVYYSFPRPVPHFGRLRR